MAAKVPANNQTVHLLSREQNPEQHWSPAGPGDMFLNSSPKNAQQCWGDGSAGKTLCDDLSSDLQNPQKNVGAVAHMSVILRLL